MIMSDEIIELVKVNLMKGKTRVNIANGFGISLWVVQSISSGHRALKCFNKIKNTYRTQVAK